jgi:hypothetical protein
MLSNILYAEAVSTEASQLFISDVCLEQHILDVSGIAKRFSKPRDLVYADIMACYEQLKG